MAKQKKKRNKSYSGVDSSAARPTVTKISAADRNPVHQWWFEKKRIAKPILIVALIAVALIWLILELVRALAA